MERREELKLTQDDLGKAIWLNKSTIQRYETGKITSIKLTVLARIIAALCADTVIIFIANAVAVSPK